MRIVLALALVGLAVQGASPAWAAGSQDQGLSITFPGSKVTQDTRFKVECGVRYRFTAIASLDDVARFYSQLASRNGLALAKDTGDEFAYSRMMGFAQRKGPRLLFVQLQRKVGNVAGTVTYRTKAAPSSCG